MLQHAEGLHGCVDSEFLSVVGHDTGTPRVLKIAGNMHVSAQDQHLNSRHRHYKRRRHVHFEPNLVWLVQAKTQRNDLEKKRKVKVTEVVSRLVGEGMVVHVRHLQDGHRCNCGLTRGKNIAVYTALTWRHKERLRDDETFLLFWGKCRVTLVGLRHCVETRFLI